MKRSFYILICVLMVLIPLVNRAQKNAMENMLNVQLKKTGIVEQQNKVKGYYSFYLIEKADRFNSIFMIKIFDENAREIINQKFMEVDDLTIMEVSFDNEAILLKFMITRFAGKGTKYYIFNKAREFKAINKPTLNKQDGSKSFNIVGPEAINENLYGIPDKGFLNYAPYKEPKADGYEIMFIDAKGEKKWNYQSQTKPDVKSIAEILTVGRNNVYNIISNYEGSEKSDAQYGDYITQSINGIDLQTGKKVFETRMEDERYKYQIYSGQESELGLIVLGMYYPNNVKMDFRNMPTGVFAETLDQTGNILSKKTVNLDSDLNKFFPLESYKSLTDLGTIYFHNFFQTADKKIYAIAENYYLGINDQILVKNALQVNTIRKPNQFMVKDLLIFEFNPDFTVAAIKVFNKSMTKFSWPTNYSYFNEAKTANVIKRQGGFDYLYTQLSQDKNSFIICYKDIDTEENASLFNFEAVVHKDDSYTTDKLNLKIDNHFLAPFPAKYGHILLSGYLKDEKKQEMRLERINF